MAPAASCTPARPPAAALLHLLYSRGGGQECALPRAARPAPVAARRCAAAADAAGIKGDLTCCWRRPGPLPAGRCGDSPPQALLPRPAAAAPRAPTAAGDLQGGWVGRSGPGGRGRGHSRQWERRAGRAARQYETMGACFQRRSVCPSAASHPLSPAHLLCQTAAGRAHVQHRRHVPQRRWQLQPPHGRRQQPCRLGLVINH